jgi:preprotein translocase subunit SecB
MTFQSVKKEGFIVAQAPSGWQLPGPGLCPRLVQYSPAWYPPAPQFVPLASESNNMTDFQPPPSDAPGAAPGPVPPLQLRGQYIKDFSFENPRAPQSLMEQKPSQLTLNVNVMTRQLEAKTFEVALAIEASAKTPENEPVFMLELIYAGTVTLGDVPQEHVGPLLAIETPRLLFPFARAIVANTTREAGLPPLGIPLVDFVALYRQRLEQAGGLTGMSNGPVGHA